MPSSFKGTIASARRFERRPRFWLQVAVGTLAVLNAAALIFYFAPPGGTHASLTAESQQLRTSIAAARAQTNRLKLISSKVETGGRQAIDFESTYILPKRRSFEEIIGEIQRMARTAKLTQRDGAWTDEAIEGSPDLSVLTNTTDFEGSYNSLMKFLYEVDHSSKLLMLDTLMASPQKAGQVTARMKFQAIVREAGAGGSGG